MENKVLAKVDGREIKDSDLNIFMRSLGQNAAYFQGEEGKKNLLNELVMHELMLSEALEKNMDKDEEFVEALNNTKKTLLQQYALGKMFEQINISEEDLKNYYETNKARFTTEEMVAASHILVDSQEKAEEIIKEINEGLSFEEAASQYSSCPSNQSGGALGQFGKGQMVKEFEDAVFAMEVGQISKPVQTQFGYHIIKLTDHTPKGESSFEDSYQKVREACHIEKQEQIYINKRNELSNKYSVEIL